MAPQLQPLIDKQPAPAIAVIDPSIKPAAGPMPVVPATFQPAAPPPTR
jgi:hypothetical protein